MKNITYSLLAISVFAISCGKKESDTSGSASDSPQGSTEVSATPESTSVAQGNEDEAAPEVEATAAKPVAGFSTTGIIGAYLKLNEALAMDDAKAAAQAGKVLQNEFNAIDADAVDPKKRADYLDLVADAKEQAEQISGNGSNIAQQRGHLAVLSKNISNLVTAFGSDIKLYQDHCPMYNDGKGAIWVSASREIRNPYYGKDMLACGSIKKEF